MKEKFNFQLFSAFIVSVVLAIISAVVRSVLTVTALDTAYGVYEHGNALPTVYHIILAISLLVLVAFALIKAPRRSPEYIRSQCQLTAFTSCVCAFMLTASTLINAYNAVYYIVENYSFLMQYEKANTFMSNEAPLIFSIIEICFAIPSIVYFLELAFSQAKRAPLLALTSFAPIAWCALCLVRIYFDSTALMVSPNKIISELTLLATMIYFLSEVRFHIGTASHKVYLASALTAPILLITSAVPNLLFAKELSISQTDNSMVYAIYLVFALFIWARLFAYAKNDSTNE